MNLHNSEVRTPANPASVPGIGTGQPHHNGQGTVPSDSAREGQPKEKGAFWATLGAVFTAIMGSACCWLPLLLIAFGFSAAGVGSFFEQYRPYFLTATFALLAVAWYFTYRAAFSKTWAQLRSRPAPVAAVEACCASEAIPAAADSCYATKSVPKAAPVHSCCGIEAEPETEDCCATLEKTIGGQPPRRRFTMRQFNQVMLWMATVMIVLFAMFPHWISLLNGGAGSNPTAAVNLDDQQQIIVELKGMTCEGCAPIVEKALRRVPGVSAARVHYEKSQAIVSVPKGQEVPRDAILQAVGQAGYSATFRK